MVCTIQNNNLIVDIETLGAQLQSIRTIDGTEFLWQGDEKYWADRAPNLFPYIGRMIDKQYEYGGKTYSMGIHGFAAQSEFSIAEQAADAITFMLCDSPMTLQQYPWKFRLHITYALKETELTVTFQVKNETEQEMLFGIGGHPGFRAPFSEGKAFEDYQLRFPNAANPQRIVFTKECFVDDETVPYCLCDQSIALSHDLFDDDAIVLTNTGNSVILESKTGGTGIMVKYPQMPYIGFWHQPKTDAPYICIEPWSSLPSHKGTKTLWEQQADLIHLSPMESYKNCWSIIILKEQGN